MTDNFFSPILCLKFISESPFTCSCPYICIKPFTIMGPFHPRYPPRSGWGVSGVVSAGSASLRAYCCVSYTAKTSQRSSVRSRAQKCYTPPRCLLTQ